MPLTARDRVVVIGKTGMGKSTHAKQLCAEQMAAGARVVVFDPHDEYSELGHATPYVRLGPLTQRCTVEELQQDPERFLDRKDLALAVVPTSFDGGDVEPEDCASQFEDCAELVRFSGELTFIVDEVGYFGEHCESKLKAVATMYRHNGITTVFVAQRAVQVPLTARSQASEIVCFCQDEQADLDALERRCSRLMPDIAERVARLRPGEHVVWRDDLAVPQGATA